MHVLPVSNEAHQTQTHTGRHAEVHQTAADADTVFTKLGRVS